MACLGSRHNGGGRGWPVRFVGEFRMEEIVLGDPNERDGALDQGEATTPTTNTLTPSSGDVATTSKSAAFARCGAEW